MGTYSFGTFYVGLCQRCGDQVSTVRDDDGVPAVTRNCKNGHPTVCRKS
ncbi:hypothetical protein [Microbispora rosea]|nr:hypothetical protein [Microbispora rosea]